MANPGVSARARLNHRRVFYLLIALGLFAVLSLVITFPDAVPTGPSLSQSLADHKISLPKYTDKLNPFKPPAHKPESQKDSEYGGSSWYSNWNWRSPFSSTTTLDENRSLLPPLKDRTPIYCYYDTSAERDAATKEAESSLLLTWRRAWWAQGFKPIILSAAEAMNNPLYNELQGVEMEPTLKRDLMGWLAWENMGGGLLASYLLLPMGPHEDHLLSFLRRGDFPELTRWEELNEALFVGPRQNIAKAIGEAFQNRQKKTSKHLITAVASDIFKVDPAHAALAFYDRLTVEKLYPEIAEASVGSRAQSLQSLNLLMNYHLHNTWQDMFSDGIAVLKPLPIHMSTMVEPALQLAKRLTACHDSPLPKSCPPNLAKCTPCHSSKPMKISTPAHHKNKTDIYTIATIPHPYMWRTLDALRGDIDVAYFRRHTERDHWLHLIFEKLLGTKISSSARVVTFKDAVAGEYATAHSLWLTGEDEAVPKDIDWWFGFALPKNVIEESKSNNPASDTTKPDHDPADGENPPLDEKALESELLRKARAVGVSKLEEDVRIREVAEAWNLADTEAWRFAKAFLARSTMERQQWEKKESKYAGGAGGDTDDVGRSGSGRWQDDKTDEPTGNEKPQEQKAKDNQPTGDKVGK
ncbi:hypothetical protein F5Y18DRAFT_371876 [Xylariaceae sp. FL1019]|nr:hypothetical protein F5Y18DRAFT_371876 [Xylariaceae sp. FL1019]